MSTGNISSAAGGGGPLQFPRSLVDIGKTIYQAIKSLFSSKPPAPLLTPQAIYTAMQGLRSELLTAMNRASAAMPEPSRKAFAAHATAMVNDVLLDCMTSVIDESARRAKGDVKEATFQKAAINARHFVDRHLQIAQDIDRQKLSTPQVRSVLVENPIGPHLPKVNRIVVLRAAPPIENLVLRGGGAKGIGNPPALRALENLGKLSELKKIVGTSAGAMTAVCLASGMSARSFQKLSNDTGMLSLLSSPSDFKERYPQVKLGMIGFGAGKALETLDRASASSVTDYLRGNWEDVVATSQWSNLGTADQERLVSLRDQDFAKSPRTGQMITFHDLHLMHQLAPARFKELVLTGYNNDQKQGTFFSAATHPNMPVALAGRISMSIPMFFKAVKMEVDGEMQSFVDGGVGSNMPSEVVLDGLHGREMDEMKAKTLLMTYDEQGAAYSILHGSPQERKNAAEGLFSRWTNDGLDGEKTYFSGTNVLPVFHGKLGAFSFAASKDQVEHAQTQSMLKTLDYIDTTMGQVRHDMVTDAAAAVRLLSLEEQSAFLQMHGDNVDPLHASLCLEIRAQSLPPRAAAGS
ncbi:patatin-like phospholipase family protein [Acidovorax sp. CCYZU-2555]|uniref:patatin-like phospholipase family protein n=1 Tax=Acidovorax sp. CCYZU-2555 TaxID=2835042 RepID=UPI001BCFE74E|nr:patatin-like phospholipase family protein [Acidovorax sp. CCYZU-2555]MBS7778822.1 patatin-like phospholipase family protein [Acidovorax sp. CCYZU-2555]